MIFVADRNLRTLMDLKYKRKYQAENGQNGMKLAVNSLPKVDVALIGEPTGMQPAVAEKGLMVLDFTVHGKAGHAARDEGVNALYRATELIEKLREKKPEIFNWKAYFRRILGTIYDINIKSTRCCSII